MSLARHEQCALRRVDEALSRSAPRLRADFCAFGSLYWGQAMPRWEQIRPDRGQRWRTLGRKLSHGAGVALIYAGGIAWTPGVTDGHPDQSVG